MSIDSFAEFIEGNLLPGDSFWSEPEPSLETLQPTGWRSKVERYAKEYAVWEALLPEEYTGMMDAIVKFFKRNPPEDMKDAIQRAAYFAWRLQQEEWAEDREDDEDDSDDLQQLGF